VSPDDEFLDDARQDAWVTLLEDGVTHPTAFQLEERTRVCLNAILRKRAAERVSRVDVETLPENDCS